MWTRDEFEKSVIAQDDDCDYEESGYVACVRDEVAYIARYSHCSCFGTFDDLCGGGVSSYYKKGQPVWDWQGSVPELLRMAERKADPTIPTRDANPDDSDYDHLCAVYLDVLAWGRDRAAAKERKEAAND